VLTRSDRVAIVEDKTSVIPTPFHLPPISGDHFPSGKHYENLTESQRSYPSSLGEHHASSSNLAPGSSSNLASSSTPPVPLTQKTAQLLASEMDKHRRINTSAAPGHHVPDHDEDAGALPMPSAGTLPPTYR
jgi:hypothetical protein